MKELEGERVYLRPTDNNLGVRSQRSTTHRCYVNATILKVARVNVTLKIDGFNHDLKYRMDHNLPDVLHSDFNSGYVVYKNKEAIDAYYEANDLASRICNKYMYEWHFAKVGIKELRQIAKLLNV